MKLRVHNLISDGMVIQRGAAVPVRGYTDPLRPVTVRFLEKTYTAVADESGTWTVSLKPSDPGGPYRMEIAAGPLGGEAEHTGIIVRDIYIGDVWPCSGQSNMELPMARIRDNYPEEWEQPINSLVRQFQVPITWDFTGPRDDMSGGLWMTASPESLVNFSGTAWFFAQKWHEKHKIPIGLIKAAAGGSPIESWMSREALRDFPRKIAESGQYADPALADKRLRENDAVQKQWHDLLRRSDEGLPENAEWFKTDLDDSAWKEMELPGFFTGEGLEEFCGVVWLRKNIAVPAELTGRELKIWLGTIVDADTVYINGREVGNTTYRYPPRKYIIPAGLLHEGINQISVRVICSNGNGGFTPDKPFKIFSDTRIIELRGTWKYKTTAAVPPKPPEFHIEWLPCGLFNAMIAPLLPYPLKGIIWYQGESNDKNPEEYEDLFLSMIQDWRNRKKQRALPFLFVQLPLFGVPSENTENSPWALLRESQMRALRLPDTGMAAALDLGEWNDLHPLNKRDIGRRLALAAEDLIDKEQNSSPGPLLEKMEKSGNILTLSFDRIGAGLVIKDEESPPGAEGKRMYVTIISKDKKISRVPATLKNRRQVVVDLLRIHEPEKILYAWADNPADRQLYNTGGLPAIPFKRSLSDTVFPNISAKAPGV
jgi:sialate O-acetylesterase